MHNGLWSEFIILFIAAVLGSIAILPYGLRLANASTKKKRTKLSQKTIVLLSIVQNSVLFAIIIILGLIAAHQIGVYIPVFQITLSHMIISLILGVVAGGVLLLLDLGFMPYLPDKLLKTALETTQLENLTASFYGGINEELLSRLFGVSVAAWLLSRIWHTTAGLPTTGVFWIANLTLALLFALGHLPALKVLTGNITLVMLARSLLLNMVVGVLCGWLFWNYGIVAAITAHFAVDIVYHIGGTYVLRFKNK